MPWFICTGCFFSDTLIDVGERCCKRGRSQVFVPLYKDKFE